MQRSSLAYFAVLALSCGGSEPPPQIAPSTTSAPATTPASSVASGSITAALHEYQHHDSAKPTYYAERLGDPVLQPTCVKRLTQFFEDAMTRADKNRDDARVKALLDVIVPPLTAAYLDDLDIEEEQETRTAMIQLLASTRDARAKPAWIKAITDFQSDQPSSSLSAVS